MANAFGRRAVNEEIHLPEGQRSYTIKELYAEERYRIGLNDGVFAHGSTSVVDVPPQTVMVFEVRPDEPTETLLLGWKEKSPRARKALRFRIGAGQTRVRVGTARRSVRTARRCGLLARAESRRGGRVYRALDAQTARGIKMRSESV